MKNEKIDAALFRKALRGASGLLEANKDEVNALNVFPVPDGDTGTNMSLTIKSAIKEGLNEKSDDTYLVALAMSKGSLMGARGNSGVILSQLCRGFANGLKGKDYIDVEALAEAFKQASDMAYQAVMKPIEGTILTVARECGDYAKRLSRKEKDVIKFLELVIEHGNKTVEATMDMLPVLKQAGVVDAGGKGLMYIITGAYYGLTGIEDYEEVEDMESLHGLVDSQGDREHIDTDDIVYGYCTEFMINTDYDDVISLREDLSVDADSLMVVAGDGIIKVHIHTNNPGMVLEKALELGELSDIKIDNMRYQHEEVLLKDELKKQELKKFGFVSVSKGKGIDDLFEELKVDKLISGGQTMNPSTEDILKAVESVNAETVFILPNNKNIILAAEQTIDLTNKKVIVVPTKSIPEGVASLMTFDAAEDADTNLANMKDYIEEVKTGEVTFAVRDTEINKRKIKKDDIIGISKGDIVASGKSIETTSLELIESMVDEDSSIISLFYGEDINEEDAESLAEILEEKYSDIDIELIYGGQPLYYYLISLE